MKNLLLAILILTIASCTGGNESIIGKPGFFDYLPSFIMLIGFAGLCFAGFKYYVATKLNYYSDEAKSKKATALILALAAGIVFVFGLATYFG